MHASSPLPEFTASNRCSEDPASTMASDVLEGLSAAQKSLPSKYFYDERGSKLFEAICDLPEYYPTRTELRLLSTHAKEIVRGLRQGDLVELGAGSNRKVRTLLDALGPWRRAGVRYVPVDVSGSALRESAAQLTTAYPELKIHEIVADFSREVRGLRSDRPKLVLFFGSTIGNLDEVESACFLRDVAAVLNPDDRFLLGLDMVKPVDILEAAYNDSRGVTAEFNKNILRVLNRELRANFDPDAFDHVAFYNAEAERVEMHLEAREDLRVEVKAVATSFTLRKADTIRTEICRKFTPHGAETLFHRAGMEVSRWYSDPKGWFSLLEARVRRR